MLMVALLAMSTIPAPDLSADLLCGTSGATLKVWNGSDAAPTRAIETRVDGSARFRVDLVAWTVAVDPIPGKQAFDLEMKDQADGASRMLKTSISCDGQAGEVLKLRIRPGTDGVQVDPSR
jgi:hypothetical protein